VYPSSKRASHAAHLAHRASFVPTLAEFKNEATKIHQDEADVEGIFNLINKINPEHPWAVLAGTG
jgi:hypothetical protein